MTGTCARPFGKRVERPIPSDMKVSPVSIAFHLSQPYAAAPIEPIAPVPGAGFVGPGRRTDDSYEPSTRREALPRVTYGQARSVYGSG